MHRPRVVQRIRRTNRRTPTTSLNCRYVPANSMSARLLDQGTCGCTSPYVAGPAADTPFALFRAAAVAVAGTPRSPMTGPRCAETAVSPEIFHRFIDPAATDSKHLWDFRPGGLPIRGGIPARPVCFRKELSNCMNGGDTPAGRQSPAGVPVASTVGPGAWIAKESGWTLI